MARPVGHLMGLLQAGGGACARWGGSVTSFEIRDAEHVRAESAHLGLTLSRDVVTWVRRLKSESF
eukprot:COSAG02_NODE_8738_length_2459_cov_0.941949_3_plen_65_part_00